MRTLTTRSAKLIGLAVFTALGTAQAATTPKAQTNVDTWGAVHSYIVQEKTTAGAASDVRSVGGHVRQDLAVIHGVSADLNDLQVDTLRALNGVHLFKDAPVGTRSGKDKLFDFLSLIFTDGLGLDLKAKDFRTNYPALVGADLVQQTGITGRGVTIAVLDTGLWTGGGDKFDGRVLASVDVVNGGSKVAGDAYGHGTHVTSIAAGGAVTKAGTYGGIAPEANLVIVRAFDAQGVGSYANVISGINWIIANQQKYKIRVLNLSFGASPQSNYWDDPLNQAVMAAWKAGIVVVASAGNEGPVAMTIGVPGNVPYVITTGALTDNKTPYDPTDDRLASFSSTGPTYEGFVKPDVVAPGGHMVGSMPYRSYLANIDPGSMDKNETLFTMSGTSQAAAVTTGVIALMLQADPTLTPDNVKCRLMASASTAVRADGSLAYSVFQQGAGLINASVAVNSKVTGCANQGLDINADLAGTQHFGGPANRDDDGNYYVMDMRSPTWGTPLSGDGYTWTRAYTWTRGYTWTQAYTWTRAFTWTRAYTWTKGFTWTKNNAVSEAYTWTKDLPWWGTTGPTDAITTPASIDFFVPNE